MKNKINSIIFTIVLSVLVSGCCSLGKPPCYDCHKKSHMGHHAEKCSECPFSGCLKKASCCALKNKEKLSLTDEQETKIKALSEKTKKSSIQIEADIEKIEVDLKAKFVSDSFDAAGINSLVDKKFELKKQLVKSLINSHAEFLSILTPEQKEQFKEIKKDCKKGCCDKDGKCDSGKCAPCHEDGDDHDEDEHDEE